MLKVLKYLKKSWVSVIVIIALLCLQAATDLALPDYTSKIVNIGIQQGGIENVAPDAIRKSQMENILLFTEEDESILEHYTLVSKDSVSEKEWEKEVKKYPELENQDIYVLNKVSEEEQEELDEKMARPLMTVSILQNEETEKTIKEQMLETIPEEQKAILEQMSL